MESSYHSSSIDSRPVEYSHPDRSTTEQEYNSQSTNTSADYSTGKQPHALTCGVCREQIQNATHEELVESGQYAYLELLQTIENLRARYNDLLRQIAESHPEVYNSQFRFSRQSSFLKKLETL
ncbi:hypothetical protein CVT24_013188 [Panaeolus cyanescens]|uniref:Uncharacterized protein n=1 Tax=Panaeolus cyanescens TaxID=181874 RepID=A0A409WAH8_9AGAR|nr:hypothetical protein CVT24_013188 [Panaeolus cyanescens]